MRKVVSILLMIIFVSVMFSGCGSKNVNNSLNGGKSTNPNSNSSNSGNNSAKSNDTVPGTELSTFMNKYLTEKSKIWDEMSKKLEDDQNSAFTIGALSYAFADLAVVEIGLFDTLLTKDGDMYRGVLMLSGIDAWKKVSEDIIEFGYDYTYKDEKNQNKKGDHIVANGKFDKSTNSLIYENYTERKGEKINRYVIEITCNSDSSYSSQVLSINNNFDISKTKKLNACFTWFEGKNIISISADKEVSDYNFTYSSIFNKKNIKPEEMASGMNIQSTASFLNGKAAFQQNK